MSQTWGWAVTTAQEYGLESQKGELEAATFQACICSNSRPAVPAAADGQHALGVADGQACVLDSTNSI